MKKPLFALFVSLIATSSLLAATYSVSVDTSAKVVVPGDAPFAPVAVVSNAVAQGAVVLYEGFPYMCLSGTNEAPASADSNFVRVGESKKLAMIQNTGATAVWVAIGGTAEATKGFRMDAGVAVTLEDYSGKVEAVTESGSSTVAVTLIYK